MAILKNVKRFAPDGSVTVTSLTLSESSFSRLQEYADGDLCIFPGFTDMHVHFREPGFSYKETIQTGRAAAARGGYTDVATMPNLSPVPDTLEHLNAQLELIGKDTSEVGIHPFGSITVGEAGQTLSNMEEMSPFVCGFSDDGKGIADPEMMKKAMEKAASLGKIISAHCEDMTLVRGGCIHDGSFAKEHMLPGICSASEWKPIERDVELASQTGCAYHVCHVSTLESVEIIRAAKKCGINVTCETAPHYLTLTQDDLKDEGRFKMNPPLRDVRDRDALIEGVLDGTIDMIATDHAPHSADEKSRGLLKSSMGIVGLETAFPVIYTHLVKAGIISLSDVVRLMSAAPRKRFALKDEPNSYSLWNLSRKNVVDPEKFASKGRSTPFEGETLYGECLLTVKNGKTVYCINS